MRAFIALLVGVPALVALIAFAFRLNEPAETVSPAYAPPSSTAAEARVVAGTLVAAPAVHREPIEPEATTVSEQALEARSHEHDLADLRVEERRLRARVRWLETELALCGSTITETTVGSWLQTVNVEERPDERTIRRMAEMLDDYPVTLLPWEGLWLAERVTEQDWKEWGPTIDEAIILYLGAARIASEVTAERLQALQEDWLEEGYFQGL